MSPLKIFCNSEDPQRLPLFRIKVLWNRTTALPATLIQLLVVCTSSANCPPNGDFFLDSYPIFHKKSERTRRHFLVTFQISLSDPACMTVAVGGWCTTLIKQTNLQYSGRVHGNSCNGMIFQLPCYPGTSRKTVLRLG